MEPGTDFRINIYYFTLGVKLYIITSHHIYNHLKEISDQKWGDIVALVRFGCLLNKSIVKEIIVKSIRLWVDICGMSYSDIKSSTSDPIYNTFLFSGYMSLAGDNPDLKKFIVSLRSRMLRYDLTCLCLYLAMSMAINGGIILSEQDLLDALIL